MDYRDKEFERLMTDIQMGDRRGNYFRFDKSINLGNIISMIGIVVTIAVFGYGIIHRMDTIELKVDLMWQSYKISPK